MDSPDSRPPPTGPLDQLGSRIRIMWVAKMTGTTLGMTGFFFAYFWLLHHPFYPIVTMPLIGLDRLIPFQPVTLPLYLSLWLYVSLAPALVIKPRELFTYGVAALTLSVLGLGIFLFWPTAVPKLEIDWTQHTSFSFLKSIDASGNACPSLHVAFAVFTAVWFARLLREMGAGRLLRALNWLWCLGILYSTMAVRQHVALDVLAGAALGLAVAAVHLRWLRAEADSAVKPAVRRQTNGPL
jgi:membrane-associated phospholipid phosphatase